MERGDMSSISRCNGFMTGTEMFPNPCSSIFRHFVCIGSISTEGLGLRFLSLTTCLRTSPVSHQSGTSEVGSHGSADPVALLLCPNLQSPSRDPTFLPLCYLDRGGNCRCNGGCKFGFADGVADAFCHALRSLSSKRKPFTSGGHADNIISLRWLISHGHADSFRASLIRSSL